MKNLFYFIAGVLFITLISATTVSVMTVKPSKPKLVLVFTGSSKEDLRDKIIEGIKAGYIVKSITVGGEYGNYCLAVMEKY